ncbi:hypothetical protein Dimus_005616, partial [Dionaea muscipula]
AQFSTTRNELMRASSDDFQRRNLQQGSNSQQMKPINQWRLNSAAAGAHHQLMKKPVEAHQVAASTRRQLQTVSKDNMQQFPSKAAIQHKIRNAVGIQQEKSRP